MFEHFLPLSFRDHDVDVVTLGQYMRPTKKHMAVSEFVTPEAFDAYAKVREMFGYRIFFVTEYFPMWCLSYTAPLVPLLATGCRGHGLCVCRQWADGAVILPCRGALPYQRPQAAATAVIGVE